MPAVMLSMRMRAHNLGHTRTHSVSAHEEHICVAGRRCAGLACTMRRASQPARKHARSNVSAPLARSRNVSRALALSFALLLSCFLSRSLSQAAAHARLDAGVARARRGPGGHGQRGGPVRRQNVTGPICTSSNSSALLATQVLC